MRYRAHNSGYNQNFQDYVNNMWRDSSKRVFEGFNLMPIINADMESLHCYAETLAGVQLSPSRPTFTRVSICTWYQRYSRSCAGPSVDRERKQRIEEIQNIIEELLRDQIFKMQKGGSLLEYMNDSIKYSSGLYGLHGLGGRPRKEDSDTDTDMDTDNTAPSDGIALASTAMLEQKG